MSGRVGTQRRWVRAHRAGDDERPPARSVRVRLGALAAAAGCALAVVPAAIAAAPATAEEPETLVGAYYFAGWWRNPAPVHYLNNYPENPQDWRADYPERKPEIGWYDDRQKLVDEEIRSAAKGGLDYFVFDFYTDRPDNPSVPGARANNNNGLTFFRSSPHRDQMRYALAYVNADRFVIDDVGEWEQYVQQWVEYFQDPQYLTIGGQPVFVILGASEMASPEQWGSADAVRERLTELETAAVTAGLPGVLIGGGLPNPSSELITALQRRGFDFLTAYSGGFATGVDQAREYSSLRTLMPQKWAKVHDYNVANPDHPMPLVPTVIQGWDRRPLLKPGEYFVHKSPELFRDQLAAARAFVDANVPVAGQRMVVIFAWNEIGEGGQLMPTNREGDAYLRQVASVFP